MFSKPPHPTPHAKCKKAQHSKYSPIELCHVDVVEDGITPSYSATQVSKARSVSMDSVSECMYNRLSSQQCLPFSKKFITEVEGAAPRAPHLVRSLAIT